MKQTKYVFVTGGVISGQGKGIVAASIGKILNHNRKIVPIKCDGYLNVDPGTMNPTEHGEVFVLEDGAEVDLDFGHYERFLSTPCKKSYSITSGKVFQALVERERKGEFLGKTVQVIPHVTGQIRETWEKIAEDEGADVLLVEIGGTVGDVENLWFLEAARELLQKKGKENVLFVHLAYIPEVDESCQQKTKPLQLSVTMLRERGIFPDIIVGRTKRTLDEKTKLKIHWLCNVELNAVMSDPDLSYTYELPLLFHEEGLSEYLKKRLELDKVTNLAEWSRLVDNLKHPEKETTIAICGKYTEVVDSYISVQEALRHAGAKHKAKVNIKWIETTHLDTYDISKIQQTLQGCDGVIIPGGFGSRGTEGKINISRYCREHNIPFLGICYGLQLAVIEFARNVCGLDNANSTEINEQTPHNVVDMIESQRTVTHKGGTMRLGSYPAELKSDSKIAALYKSTNVSERHRHRYEVNPKYHDILQKQGLILAGLSPDKTLVEFIELANHPYFVATQAHPELKSTLENPAPLFNGLISACLK